MYKKRTIWSIVILIFAFATLYWLYWRSTHVPIFPETDGKVISITAYWSDCCREYRKDLSTPEAAGAAMDRLRQLTYNPHKEDLFGPKPGGWVIRLALQYEDQEQPKVVSLAQGGTLTFNPNADPYDFPLDEPGYFMTFHDEETLWDSFDAPAVLLWEYTE